MAIGAKLRIGQEVLTSDGREGIVSARAGAWYVVAFYNGETFSVHSSRLIGR